MRVWKELEGLSVNPGIKAAPFSSRAQATVAFQSRRRTDKARGKVAGFLPHIGNFPPCQMAIFTTASFSPLDGCFTHLVTILFHPFIIRCPALALRERGGREKITWHLFQRERERERERDEIAVLVDFWDCL